MTNIVNALKTLNLEVLIDCGHDHIFTVEKCIELHSEHEEMGATPIRIKRDGSRFFRLEEDGTAQENVYMRIISEREYQQRYGQELSSSTIDGD